MIFNPIVSGGGANQPKSITIDVLLTDYGFPNSAVPGDYVVSTSGSVSYSVLVNDETNKYELTVPVVKNSVDELPPKVREKLESAPQAMVSPPSAPGYLYFVMPSENINLVAYG